ncbi:GCN5 family acetyltransferase [Shewanella baltica]|uniref:GNAT family N-acetyltransferase n=1 Tax=Shewanella TaxID=22 RepID=UPI0001E110E5|nr:GNAT family N-acetyltransferase [Shewanella baltica]AEG11784.1 GCN5-related N-acetyltransferase [Shewanella baltica BA175]EHQ14680.1 GCN5-related N-acetyltransferase [Shewanella baltica OS183]KZK68856.1 GCN5 family acetyltransferase [Shewanella baltica]
MASIITRADVTHVHEVAVLFNEYRQFYGRRDDVAAAEQFIHARLLDESSVIFIAKDNQGLGLGFVQMYPSFSSLRMAPMLILNDVYVTQHARCVGIGRALVQQAASYAKAHNMSYLMLETQQKNQRAQGLYEGLGFVRNQDFYIYELEIHRGLE